eukprot:scaffold48314_cov51-Phaeocystis_antarctica.AAC.4
MVLQQPRRRRRWRRRHLRGLKWTMPSSRQCAACEWPSPTSASSRCSPGCGCSSQTWERPPRRSAWR